MFKLYIVTRGTRKSYVYMKANIQCMYDIV